VWGNTIDIWMYKDFRKIWLVGRHPATQTAHASDCLPVCPRSSSAIVPGTRICFRYFNKRRIIWSWWNDCPGKPKGWPRGKPEKRERGGRTFWVISLDRLTDMWFRGRSFIYWYINDNPLLNTISCIGTFPETWSQDLLILLSVNPRRRPSLCQYTF